MIRLITYLPDPGCSHDGVKQVLGRRVGLQLHVELRLVRGHGHVQHVRHLQSGRRLCSIISSIKTTTHPSTTHSLTEQIQDLRERESEILEKCVFIAEVEIGY